MKFVSRPKVPIFASHGLVLLHLARDPQLTMRRLALLVEISERRVAGIIRDLEEGGMLRVVKRGRRNTYFINEQAVGLHPSLADIRLGDVIRVTTEAGEQQEKNTGHFLPSFILPFASADADTFLSLLPILI